MTTWNSDELTIIGEAEELQITSSTSTLAPGGLHVAVRCRRANGKDRAGVESALELALEDARLRVWAAVRDGDL